MDVHSVASSITVCNEKQEMWNNFRLVKPDRAVLRGTISTTDPRFKLMSRGRQESSAAAVAVVCGHLFQPADWTSNGVDKVLDYGDRVFRASHARCNLPADAYLTTNLLQSEFFVVDYKCQISIEPGVIVGNLATETTAGPPLNEGIRRYFQEHSYGILTTQGMSVAIWKHETDGYFCFDAAPTDEYGKRCQEGVACLIRSPTIEGILEVFSENLTPNLDSRYTLDNVKLIKVKSLSGPSEIIKSSGSVNLRSSELNLDKKMLGSNTDVAMKGPRPQTIPEESEIKRFSTPRIMMSNVSLEAKFNKPLPAVRRQTTTKIETSCLDTPEMSDALRFLKSDPTVAIIHGWTHAFSEPYKAQGEQMSVNCVMAVAYKKTHPVRLWTRESIDEILALGNSIYDEVKATKPNFRRITTADLNEFKFKLSGANYIVDTDLLTIVGTFKTKNPAVISLKTGLEEFFVKNTDGILESEPITVAVWQENNHFYMFDSAQCDCNGLHLSDNVSADKIPIGKSCLMRFNNQSALLNHLMNNVHKSQNFCRYTIKRIGILDDLPGTRDWFYYKAGQLGKNWILQGTNNCELEAFKKNCAGLDGIAIPIAAIMTYKLLEPKKWYKSDVDEIIREADSYCKWCMPNNNNKGFCENQIVNLKTMKKFIYYKKRKIEIQVNDFQLLGEIEPSSLVEEMDLKTAVEQFFNDSDTGVVEANKKFIAIWKHEEVLKDSLKEMGYYLFVSRPTETFMRRFRKPGEEEQEFVPCVLRFLDKAEVVEVLKDLLLDNSRTGARVEFGIHEIKPGEISDIMTDEEIEKDKNIPVLPELRHYVPAGQHGAVLVGSCVQGDEIIFKRDTRDKQEAANALVALTMASLFNPHLWNLEVVDDILRIGNKLTEENMKNLPETVDDGFARDYLLPNEINPEFNIGVNEIFITVKEGSCKGKLAELDKFLEDYFASKDRGIFRKREIMMPIWKEEDTGTYFVFDPRGMLTGNACVYWFMDLHEMSDVMVKCTGKERGGFLIDHVAIKNSLDEAERKAKQENKPVERDWYKFRWIEDGVWKVDCLIPLDDDRFAEDCRGRQSAAVCVMAVVFSKVYEPRSWTAAVINEVMVAGSKLHIRSAARMGGGEPTHPRDVCNEFFLSNRKINLSMQDSVLSGKILDHNRERNIDSGLAQFFANYSTGCLIIEEREIFALWKYGDFVYLFEPGVDLKRFEKLEVLAQKLREFGNVHYDIVMIETIDMKKDHNVKSMVSVADSEKASTPSKRESPANNNINEDPQPKNLVLSSSTEMTLRSKDSGVLNGTKHQSSDIFPDGIKGRQTAANCMVALATATIKNPKNWTPHDLDHILLEGVNLHKDSNKLNNKLTILKPKDLVRVFKLDGVFQADIYNDVVSGMVRAPHDLEDYGKGGGRRDSRKTLYKAQGEKLYSDAMLLEEGLDKFFQNYKAGILITGRFMVAIWKDNDIHFVYDPMARNKQGHQCDPHDPDAASCLIWSGDKDAIFETIYQNIPESEKGAFWQICSVSLKSIPIEPLPSPVTYKPAEGDDSGERIDPTTGLPMEAESLFIRQDKDMSIIRAETNIHQDVFPSENQGFQSTAVAVVAVISSTIHAPLAWTPPLLDAILKIGDKLHSECASVHSVGQRMLTLEEIHDVLLIGDVRARIKIVRNISTGVAVEFDLRESLELFFEKNPAGIMYTSKYAIALMKHWQSYFFLEPSNRYKSKDETENGGATLIKCDNIAKLAKIITKVYAFKEPMPFSLNAVRVLEARCLSS